MQLERPAVSARKHTHRHHIYSIRHYTLCTLRPGGTKWTKLVGEDEICHRNNGVPRKCVRTKRYAIRAGCVVLRPRNLFNLCFLFTHTNKIIHFQEWLPWLPDKELQLVFFVVRFDCCCLATYHHTTGERNSSSAVRVGNNVTVANTQKGNGR